MADEKVLSIDTSEISRKLKRLLDRVPVAADRLLGRVALQVEREAKELTPVDTGALKASIGSAWNGGEHAPAASYNGEEIPRFTLDPRTGEAMIYATMDYAAAVHEDLQTHHDVGGPKFIENALDEVAKDAMMETIAQHLLKDVT